MLSVSEKVAIAKEIDAGAITLLSLPSKLYQMMSEASLRLPLALRA